MWRCVCVRLCSCLWRVWMTVKIDKMYICRPNRSDRESERERESSKCDTKTRRVKHDEATNEWNATEWLLSNIQSRTFHLTQWLFVHKDSIRDWNVSCFFIVIGRVNSISMSFAPIRIYYVMCHRHTATFLSFSTPPFLAPVRYMWVLLLVARFPSIFPASPSLLFHYLSKAIFFSWMRFS